jgi:hypothetical protein
MAEILTKWTNEAVDRVVRREVKISGLNLDTIYGIDEQSMTGGPVLRGPWGSLGGMQRDWDRYEKMIKHFIAAHVHGFLVARRQRCEDRGGCSTGGKFCADCGGAV